MKEGVLSNYNCENIKQSIKRPLNLLVSDFVVKILAMDFKLILFERTLKSV